MEAASLGNKEVEEMPDMDDIPDMSDDEDGMGGGLVEEEDEAALKPVTATTYVLLSRGVRGRWS